MLDPCLNLAPRSHILYQVSLNHAASRPLSEPGQSYLVYIVFHSQDVGEVSQISEVRLSYFVRCFVETGVERPIYF